MYNKEKILIEYRNIIGTDSLKARSIIKKLPFKEDFYLLQCIAQTYLDESRFEEDGTRRKESDWRKWRMAEKYIIKAFTIDQDNAEVLYTMGNIRRDNFQNDIAIYCFKKIIKLGVSKIARQKYSRGKDFAEELVNDAKFELYRLFHEEGDMKLAKRYLAMYKKSLEKGVNSIYMPLEDFLLD